MGKKPLEARGDRRRPREHYVSSQHARQQEQAGYQQQPKHKLAKHLVVDLAVGAQLPPACCAVSVTPLLRELLTRAAHLPYFYEEGGANSRLVAVLLDELAAAQVEDLHLPMPSDPRLRKVADEMIASPADRGSLKSWAQRAGMSERTLERLINRQTGMSFGRWRQQLGVVLAVKWLAGGASIQQVAGDLGYESVPSFVTMFRKALGTSPARYMAERHSG